MTADFLYNTLSDESVAGHMGLVPAYLSRSHSSQCVCTVHLVCHCCAFSRWNFWRL